MGFPYFEIQLNSRRLKNGEYKAGCSISEHTGDGVHVILPRWELKNRNYKDEEEANRTMIFNAKQYLSREYGAKDSKIRIFKSS